MEESNNYSTIAEMSQGIILSRFTKPLRVHEPHQNEAQLERELMLNLEKQGYEVVPLHTPEALLENLKKQIEKLNQVHFSAVEWERFLFEYLDKPNEGMKEKIRKIQEDNIYDFIFDDGHIKNIKIIDKYNIHNNFLQVTNQISQIGTHANRYDVTILINGLPLIQVELKKRGVNLAEAFNQIHRYSKESFNAQHSLFKYIQIFVISNGTYTRYFANTTLQDKNNYEFTCEWADAKNKAIHDLEDFTATFFEKRTLLEVLTKYCIFTAEDVLMIMRPYQIAATERMLWKIESSYQNKKWSRPEAGGFIWHTTGSGKTLTSFKAARLATNIDYIDKVFFVVDRKDLDYQTLKEYQKFQANSVNGTKDTKALKQAIEKQDNKIIVTTIQKLNQFIKSNSSHAIYDKHCVLIFDECHRSQFGEAQKNIQKNFKKYYQFGFTGTPILVENAFGSETTASVFGAQLHSYVITDAIRDKKVLKFKVDYNTISAQFEDAEKEINDERDPKILKKMEKQLMLHPERIKSITKHILKVFNTKTHRNEHYSHKQKKMYGFNAMFAVQNIDAAKLYYEEFKKQQKNIPHDKQLRIATIYSFAANEPQSGIGTINDENFEPNALDSSSKEFLENVIIDYNRHFKTNFSTDGAEFQNYYKDLSKKVKDKEIDLLIVVGMFLTGFDAPTLNTLFVDKNLRYHGLIQAYSRTNRIFNSVKTFGNIVCFRDLEKATKEAIKLFGDENSINIILEKSYKDYMTGFTDEETGDIRLGFEELSREIIEKFPDSTNIYLEADKKEFCVLFGELLKVENILKNFDEFETFTPIISERQMQDMKSTYVDIRDEMQNSKKRETENNVDFSDIEFQIDLLKTDEINLDYILAIILENAKERDDTEAIKDNIRRVIRSSMGTRAKEDLIMRFVDISDFSVLEKTEDILEAFYKYAKKEKEKAILGLTEEENLKEGSKRFIEKSIEKGYASSNGDDLDRLLPPTSRRAGARETKKQSVLEKIQRLVDVFIDI